MTTTTTTTNDTTTTTITTTATATTNTPSAATIAGTCGLVELPRLDVLSRLASARLDNGEKSQKTKTGKRHRRRHRSSSGGVGHSGKRQQPAALSEDPPTGWQTSLPEADFYWNASGCRVRLFEEDTSSILFPAWLFELI